MKFKRIFIIVADSMGIGNAPDAHLYTDKGANTFGHIADQFSDFKVSNLASLGIGNICQNKTVKSVQNPKAVIARLEEQSVGKDTLTGHFEIMGLKVTEPYPSFTDTGFPDELIKKLEDFSARKVIGNKSASGTEILVELGEEQLKTGALIVYTSADSVLQIAANEEIIPLEELYRICEYARRITTENKEWQVGRIIARPFVGKTKETFKRTANRHDYALKPFAKTALDFLQDAGFDTLAVGKIYDIFDGQGISKTTRSKSNYEGMKITINHLNDDFTGICFTNLVDFDALYGHRRDSLGYKKAIEEFDMQLGEFMEKMNDDDLLIVTADHGNDPIHHGTDHTRELVPMLCYHKSIVGKDLGTLKSFACIAQTICENFDTEKPTLGESFLKEL